MKNPWTASEDEQLVTLRKEGKMYFEIAWVMNRTQGAVSSRFRYLHLPDRKRKAERKANGNYYIKREYHYVHDADEKIKVPDHVLEERNRRRMMQPPSLTAMLMGDPVR